MAAVAAVVVNPAAAAAPPEVVAAGRVVAVVVAVRPEAVGAADPVNNYKSSGASLFGGAPFFC